MKDILFLISAPTNNYRMVLGTITLSWMLQNTHPRQVQLHWIPYSTCIQ